MANRVLVFGDKRGTCSPSNHHRRDIHRLKLWQSVRFRQIDREAAPRPDFAVHHHVATRLSHDTVQHGEAKPGPTVQRLGREERLKDAAQMLPFDSRPRVADLQQNPIAGRNTTCRNRIVGHHPCTRGLDVQHATARHRVARIDRQVQERLLHLTAIR